MSRIIVRFVNGLTDFQYESIEETTKISDMLEEIKSTYPEIAQRNLRIIYQGRVLNEDQLVLDCIRIPTGDVNQTVYMHCVISEVQSSIMPQVDYSLLYSRVSR